MMIGYARVSTHDQNLDLQRDALEAAGCEKVYEDKVSGASRARNGLDSTLDALREGDTLVVWRLDRLGRSLKHLIEVVGDLEKRGVGFKSLQESIDTTSSTGNLVFQIFGAIAEFERNLIRERTHAGLAAARARGRKGGRAVKLSPQRQKLLYELYDAKEKSIREVCEVLGISKKTLYEYLKRRPTATPRMRADEPACSLLARPAAACVAGA
jgi:DNA invertase Pin-like site-specific DNA recombinase